MAEPAYLFDRAKTSHPWSRALSEMSQGDLERRLLAANWRMDPRVSEERETAMLAAEEFSEAPDEETWWAQERRNHFRNHLCRPAAEDSNSQASAYLRVENSSNRIPVTSLPPHERLIHVASLNAILWRLATGEYPDFEFQFFAELGMTLGLPVVRDWTSFSARVDTLAEQMNAKGEDEVKRLAGLLCEQLGATEPPWWAAFSEELQPFLEAQDWTGLAQALGLGHFEEGMWILVWQYDVGEVHRQFGLDCLRRPTVVEANDSPFHFPSPSNLRFGVTMPLSENDQVGACRELLHPPLRGQIARTASFGRLVRLSDAPLPDRSKLLKLRALHRHRLASEHSIDSTDWLDRHPFPTDP